MKILVAEDNPLNLKLMTILLGSLGIEATFAQNGKDAIEKAKAHGPDVIICDIQMPEVDGYGVLDFIKSQPALQMTKVVAVTAHAMAGDKEKILSRGFDAYFAKPVDTRELRKYIVGIRESLDAESKQ